MTPDIDSHIIECRALNGDHYYAEVQPGLTLKQAAELIRSGQVERVTAVYSFNPVEKWSNDVTEDAAREVANARNGIICRGAIEFIETNVGFDMANEVRLLAEVA